VAWLALWLLAAIAAIIAVALIPVDGVPLRKRLAATLSRHPLRERRTSKRLRRCAPVGPPIEDIAANLHRLQLWLDKYADPQPIPGKATKLAATVLAYDRVLAQACCALRIAESLAETAGVDHEAERLRVQAALADAGFVLAAPHRTS
jgi:hypothetical protein